MLRVRYERCTNAQHELRVDFAVRVLCRVQQRDLKLGRGDLAVRHGDVGLEVRHLCSGLPKVCPFNVLVLDDPSAQSGAVAFGNGFW